jgi:hypothetical protein
MIHMARFRGIKDPHHPENTLRIVPRALSLKRKACAEPDTFVVDERLLGL